MRILAIDVGDRRIGLAISDELEIMATPLDIIENDDEAGAKLLQIIKNRKVEKIVVGIPYTLKGEISDQAKKVISFIEGILDENLAKELGVEIVYFDERFTTKISYQLKSTKHWGKNNKIDDVAACIILNDYLDSSRKKK